MAAIVFARGKRHSCRCSDSLSAVVQDTPIGRESARAGRRCAQGAIRKPAGGSCRTGISRMASTRACGGPDRRVWTKSSTRFGDPAMRTSTLPSGRLRTVPRRPRAAAVVRAHQRKPTPWTRPNRMKARRVSAPEGGQGPSSGFTVGRRRGGVSGRPPRGSCVRAKGKRRTGMSHAGEWKGEAGAMFARTNTLVGGWRGNNVNV